MNTKTPEESLKLFEDMAKNSYQWGNNRGKAKVAGVYETDVMTTLLSKVEALSKVVNGLAISQSSHPHSIDAIAESGGHKFTDQVDYLGNSSRPQNNPYSNTYNLG